MKKIALLVGVVTALVGSEAHAETDADNFNPQTSFRPNEFPWTSGPIDLILGVDVEFTASAYHEIDIEMVGQAEYDFDAQTLNFTGDEDGGVMENALGVEIGVIVTHVPTGLSFDLGLYNIEETANGTFSPYLLPGDIERPFGVTEAIGPNDLIDQTFTIAGFPITIDIDWQLNIPGVEYQSLRIDLSDGEDSIISNEVGVYDAEDDNLDLILPDSVPGETSTMYGTLHGQLDAEIAFIFIINATVSEVPVGPIEIPLDYPVNEGVEVEFPVEQINFDVPLEPEPEPGTSTGEAGDSSSSGEPAADSSGGDSDSDSDSTTGDGPVDPTDAGGSGETGGLPAAPSPSDAGCGCTTNTDAGGFAWLLGLFGLAMLRRRRD